MQLQRDIEFENFVNEFIKNLSDEERFKLIDGLNILFFDVCEKFGVEPLGFIKILKESLKDEFKDEMDIVLGYLLTPYKFIERKN